MLLDLSISQIKTEIEIHKLNLMSVNFGLEVYKILCGPNKIQMQSRYSL